jgi:glycosyltransferase involved in cell wall biosynthesis
LVKEGNNAQLLLIGEGPTADAIRALSPKNVYLVGQVSNLHDYLSICDIGILPSYFPGESFPLILLDMMCNSLPIIASDIGDIPWIVGFDNDAAGITISMTESGIDENELYLASLKLSNPVVRSKFSANSRKRFEENFSIDIMVDRYLSLYCTY